MESPWRPYGVDQTGTIVHPGGTATVSAKLKPGRHLFYCPSTGLAPARYESATIRRSRAISRLAPGERRDALMGVAWGLAQHSVAFGERDRELRAPGMRPIEARVALARHACRLCHTMLQTQEPFEEKRYARARHRRGR
jgi:hypothetical protein